MTETEIEAQAEEFAKERCRENMCYRNCNVHKNHHCGYWHYNYECALKGIKWGMEHAIEWHDLRENPNDLPDYNNAVLICFRFEKWTTTYIAYYRPSKKWQIYNLLEAQRQPIADDYIDSEEVIAWCELPQFKDKE